MPRNVKSPTGTVHATRGESTWPLCQMAFVASDRSMWDATSDAVTCLLCKRIEKKAPPQEPQP